MSEILMLGFASLAGILLGALFFGGLWWTVLKGVSARQPGFWFLASLLLRSGLALAGFYFVSGDSWKRLLACLLGFIIARMIITKLTAIPMTIPLSPSSLPQAGERDADSLRDAQINEASHAP